MDLHPGEQIVFEGHPSWRALLSFYIGGVAARRGGRRRSPALIWGWSARVRWWASCCWRCVLVFGLRQADVDHVPGQHAAALHPARHALQAHAADAHRPRAERQHRAVAARAPAARGDGRLRHRGHRRQRVPLRRHRQPGRRWSPPSIARSARRRRRPDGARRSARGVPREPPRARGGDPAARHVARRAAVLLPGLAARARRCRRAATWCSSPTGRRGWARSSACGSSVSTVGGRRRHDDRDPARAGRGRRSSTGPTGRSTTRCCARRRPTRCGRGRSGPRGRGRAWRSASSRWRRACRSSSTPAASTATRSCAASRARARRTRWG